MMRGYSGIDRVLSPFIHFVRNLEVDDIVAVIAKSAKEKGIVISYTNVNEMTFGSGILEFISYSLPLDNKPYNAKDWIPFLDDLITLSYKIPGLILVVDRADILLKNSPYEMFDLIECFLIQSHHWSDKNKPCHLCFQMEESDLVRRIFAHS